MAENPLLESSGEENNYLEWCRCNSTLKAAEIAAAHLPRRPGFWQISIAQLSGNAEGEQFGGRRWPRFPSQRCPGTACWETFRGRASPSTEMLWDLVLPCTAPRTAAPPSPSHLSSLISEYRAASPHKAGTLLPEGRQSQHEETQPSDRQRCNQQC